MILTVWILTLFSIAGSWAERTAHLDAGPIKPIASAALLLCLFWGLVAPFDRSRRFWFVLTGLLVGCALIEVVGVVTPFPFGEYEYTRAWVPYVPFGEHYFPVLLPVAWGCVILGSHLVATMSCESGRRAVIAGAVAVLIDIPMEHTMSQKLNYWAWGQGDPPIQNYVAWFLIAAGCSFALSRVTQVDRTRSVWIGLHGCGALMVLNLGLAAVMA